MKTWLRLADARKQLETDNEEFIVVKKAKELKVGDRVLYSTDRSFATPNEDSYIDVFVTHEITDVRTEDQVIVNGAYTFIHCEAVKTRRGPMLAKNLVLGDQIDVNEKDKVTVESLKLV